MTNLQPVLVKTTLTLASWTRMTIEKRLIVFCWYSVHAVTPRKELLLLLMEAL